MVDFNSVLKKKKMKYSLSQNYNKYGLITAPIFFLSLFSTNGWRFSAYVAYSNEVKTNLVNELLIFPSVLFIAHTFVQPRKY